MQTADGQANDADVKQLRLCNVVKVVNTDRWSAGQGDGVTTMWSNALVAVANSAAVQVRVTRRAEPSVSEGMQEGMQMTCAEVLTSGFAGDPDTDKACGDCPRHQRKRKPTGWVGFSRFPTS
jgi:hypothetical protein